jgi:hypothetical protein
VLNLADDDQRQELSEIGEGCERVLRPVNSIVTKYAALSEERRMAGDMALLAEDPFGNGEMLSESVTLSCR